MDKRALIVHEDVVLLSVLQKLLSSIEYLPRPVESIEQLNEVSDPHFDMVVTDILFKGIAPLEHLSKIHDRFTFERIFIVTEMELEDFRDSASNIHPIDGFFATPFDVSELQQALLSE